MKLNKLRLLIIQTLSLLSLLCSACLGTSSKLDLENQFKAENLSERGDYYFAAQKLDYAENLYLLSIQYFPNLEAYNGLASIYFAYKDFLLAKYYCDLALGIDSENQELLSNQAAILLQLEQDQEAENICRSILRRDPGNYKALNILYYILKNYRKQETFGAELRVIEVKLAALGNLN